MTTANTARDMDEIRAALGEETISYVGYSYGSYLGAVYASLHPDRTDRVVLDSVVDPGGVWRDVFRSWGPAVEIRFPDLTSWIADRHDTYGLGTTSRQVRSTYFDLAGHLDDEPIQLPELLLTGNQFRQINRAWLYNDASFPNAATLWQAVHEHVYGDGSLAALDAGFVDEFPEVPSDNEVAGALGIMCGDAAWPRDIDTYRRDVRVDSRRFPVAGAMAANVWACAAWPTAPDGPPAPVTDDGPANILLVQTLRDPATPYLGAARMRDTMRNRSRLITIDSGTHAVFAFGVNQCADDLTTRFLVTGTLPRDSFCRADRPMVPDAELTPAEADAVEAVRREMWLLG